MKTIALIAALGLAALGFAAPASAHGGRAPVFSRVVIGHVGHWYPGPVFLAADALVRVLLGLNYFHITSVVLVGGVYRVNAYDAYGRPVVLTVHPRTGRVLDTTRLR